MKWINNGIEYKRGNHEFLIAKYDDVDVWFVTRANIITQQAQKSGFRKLGEYLEAKKVEVMKMYDDNDEWAQENIVVYDTDCDGNYKFYNLNEDGSMSLIKTTRGV